MLHKILTHTLLLFFLVSCTDDIDKSNRFTFTGETMADFLLNRNEEYSHFINMLQRADLFGLLNTYCQYTLFLPDNGAVEKYLQEKESIYHATKETESPIWTGITSPFVEELSDSMANVIVRNHLVEGNYLTASFDDGALPRWNFYDRYLGISFEPTEESFYIKVNTASKIIDGDNQVENGIIHIVDRVIEVTNNTLPEQIAEYSFFSLFSKALDATGLRDSLHLFIDDNYTPLDIDYTPLKKYHKYTAFIETDEVFNSAGIYTLENLYAFAEKWYGTEDRDNYKSPRNALYKFVAYHFVPRELAYNKIIPLRLGLNGEYSINDYIVEGYDCHDYFETMMGRLMKVTKPLSTPEGIYVYINRPVDGRIYNHEMRRHMNVRLIEPTEFIQAKEEYSHFNAYAMNGIIQPIDRVLIYNDDEMSGNILNERMRFDFSSLLPELSCNGIRHTDAFYLPYSYCRGIVNNSYSSDCFVYSIIPTCMAFDCIRAEKMFDISFRLPPLPSRTYEIRLSVHLQSNDFQWTNAVMQPYLDDKPCSLPIDTRLSYYNPKVGWKADSATVDNGVENDRQMRNREWMKGPDSFKIFSSGEYIPSRTCSSDLRKIVTKAYLGEGEHWLRFKNLNENCESFVFDYLELVPLHIVNNPIKPEDRH